MKRKIAENMGTGKRGMGKKILAALLSAVMLLGMTSTALASEERITVTDETSTVKTVWTVASEVMFDENETFTLKLSYEGKSPVGTNVLADPMGIVTGTPKQLPVGGTGKWSGSGKVHQASLTYASLFQGISFTTPGIYSFTLQVQDKGHPNIASSTQSYRLEVPVVWATDGEGNLTGGLALKDILVYQRGEGQEGAKVENTNLLFEHTPKANGSLTVTKTVKGNAANKEDTFAFTIMITGVSGTYPASDGTVTAAKGTITKSVSLKHGSSYTLSNLPAGAAYTVTEGSNDYPGKAYTIDGGQTVVIGDGEEAGAKGTVKEGTTTVAFENTKNTLPATGIATDIMPYVLLLGGVILGGGAFLVLRRRRTEI